MSGIVLSSSVRQNLLSLQSTADLLSTTQNRLATGKKVNTALDNPTNFFTARRLDNRASDINNLLDGIGNGVQVLQAANTGITSLQKLVDSASRSPTRRCRRPSAIPRSHVTAAITGATAANLRGTTSYTSATASCERAVLPARPAAPPRPLCVPTLGGTSASLVGVAAATVPATAASLAFGHDPGWCGPAPRPIAANGAAVRRRDPDRQRQDHHLQVGFGPGGGGCSRRIRPQRQYRHRRQRQLHRLHRHHGHADGDGAGSGERHRPRQRRPEDHQRRRRGGPTPPTPACS